MNRVIRKSLTALTCCLVPWLPMRTVTAGVAQVPLYLGGVVDPNIMFTLDDSGSMQYEVTEELAARFATFVYPPPAGVNVYGGDEIYEADNGINPYSPFVSDVVDDTAGNPENPYSMQSRSYGINKAYYDPSRTYKPWVAKDESGLMPAAEPSCAPHNPFVPDLDKDGVPGNSPSDCRDFTIENSEQGFWLSYADAAAALGFFGGVRTYWPAFYYQYNDGDDPWDTASFVKVEIRPGGTYPGGAERDCADPLLCTYNEEIQNFANWYSYYRSRILLSRAGAGRAFSRQGTKLRLGFAAINQGSETVDGVESPGALITGVRGFSGADREAFFDTLYSHAIIAGAPTPLRGAADAIGQYFERDDNSGPWGQAPGTNDDTPHLSCRQSYNILTTDGYWNGAAVVTPGTSDADDTDGPVITPPDGEAFQYVPDRPYEDGHSDTLADATMHYWKRDLRPDLVNNVTVTPEDPAFWQHLVHFTVGLGVTGTLDPETDLPDITAGTKSWPDPSILDPQCGECVKIDDLWHAAVNSRGDFHSAGDPDKFADAIDDSLQSIALAQGSSTGITANSTRANADTKIFQARFNSEGWYGQLLAFEVDQLTGQVAGDPAWEAGEELDQRNLDRVIVTHEAADTDADGQPGVNFSWADLPDSHKADLNNDPDCAPEAVPCVGEIRLDYLQGTRTQEEQSGGPFRNRVSILWAIVNSDPWFAGQQDFGYNILPGDEGTSYITFRNTESYMNRPGVVYVGAGPMLHAFDSDTGEELFAYVPETLFPDLWWLTDPAYTQRYYVDGPPKVGDVYIESEQAWKSILVGTTGAGGKAVFALDVTDPENFGIASVLWEFTAADDDGDGKDIAADGNPDGDLGLTIGQASIVRMANGEWAAVFGNGYESTNGNAVLYIVNIADGTLIRKIDTGAGPANGLSTPIAVDVNGDRIVDRIYGGDLLGNLWAFDVSSANSDDWGVDYAPAPLFTARSPDDVVQPITSQLQVGRHPQNGVLVYFGTGKYFEVGDGALMDGDAGFKNTFYAIWDDFNADGATPVSGARDGGDVTGLLKQQITFESEAIVVDGDEQVVLTGRDGSQTTQAQPAEIRVTSDNQIDWATDRGWYMDLDSPVLGWEGERVINKAQLIGDILLFTTIIPSPYPCEFGGSGWLMELSSKDGARLPFSPFDLNSDDFFDEGDYVDTEPGDAENKVAVSGRKFDGLLNQPWLLGSSDRDKVIVIGSDSGGDGTFQEDTPLAIPSGRQSWRQLR